MHNAILWFIMVYLQLIVQAKRKHLSLCIQSTLRMYPEASDCVMRLLDNVMRICAENTVSSQIVRAISRVLPGMSQCRNAPVRSLVNLCFWLSVPV